MESENETTVSILSIFRRQREVEPLEGAEACMEAEFPICLEEGLLRMFGEGGKKTLDRIVMNETFENTPITSLNDIEDLYDKYMERTANILGDSIAKVIEFQCFKQREPTFCARCPLYGRGHQKRKNAGLT